MADITNIECSWQGAEARVYRADFWNRACIVKERFVKEYRHPVLDKSLTISRMKTEAKAMTKCRAIGIRTPTVYHVDLDRRLIIMEFIQNGIKTRDVINSLLQASSEQSRERLGQLASQLGRTLALMHDNQIVHGDLTTSNVLLIESEPEADIGDAPAELVLIDFGLSFISTMSEDKGVDLYVLERAFLSSHPNTEWMFSLLLESYRKHSKKATEVLNKLEDVRARGRKRTMVG